MKPQAAKQILHPEKPIHATVPLFFWCPCCGSAIKKRIEDSIRIINNCPYCGQALDWSGTE